MRLVCVFLQSLIKNKIIQEGYMDSEIECFCVEFIKISEASALYKLVKHST